MLTPGLRVASVTSALPSRPPRSPQHCAKPARSATSGAAPSTEVTSANFRARAAAAIAAAAKVAQSSPTARARPSAAGASARDGGTAGRTRLQRWRTTKEPLALCSTEPALEEILSRELRRSGLAPVKLGAAAWCVSRGAVSHLFALLMDEDFEALRTAEDLAAELQALLEPEALEEALEAARGEQSKVPRYDIRFSSERTSDLRVLTLEPKLRQVVSESLRRGLEKKVSWRFDEKRPQVTLWVHWGPSCLALGLASVLSAERRETCRLSALGLLGAEAAQGGALADPCCGQGKEPSRVVGRDVRQAALKTAQNALGSAAELCTGDGGQLALQPGEADAVLCDLPNSGEPEEWELLKKSREGWHWGPRDDPNSPWRKALREMGMADDEDEVVTLTTIATATPPTPTSRTSPSRIYREDGGESEVSALVTSSCKSSLDSKEQQSKGADDGADDGAVQSD
eukprot:s1474_g4.t1